MLQKMIRTELTTKDYMERLEKALETLKGTDHSVL